MDGRLIQWVTHLYYIYLFYQINAQGRRAEQKTLLFLVLFGNFIRINPKHLLTLF